MSAACSRPATRIFQQSSREARAAWIERFTNFFTGASLDGKRLLVYQHSAVGRDLLVEVLERMGAEVIAARTQRYLRSHRYGEYRCARSWP